MTLMSLAKYALLPPVQVVDILTIAAQTSRKCNSWVDGDLTHRIGEATISQDTVRVATGAISFIPNRLGVFRSCSEFFGSVR